MNSGSSASTATGSQCVGLAVDDLVVPAVAVVHRRPARPCACTTSTCLTVSVPGADSAWSTLALSGMRLAAAHALVRGDHDGRGAVGDAARERIRREAAEHHRVNRADARAGEHRDRRLGNHRQVDRDAVALLHAERPERVRELADAVIELAVGDALRLSAGSSPSQMIAVLSPRVARWRSRQLTETLSCPSSNQRMRNVVRVEAHVAHPRVRADPVDALAHAAPRIPPGRVIDSS